MAFHSPPDQPKAQIRFAGAPSPAREIARHFPFAEERDLLFAKVEPANPSMGHLSGQQQIRGASRTRPRLV
jgi:hypothetical protein